MLGQKSWNPFKKEDPKQLVRTWQSTIRKEIRGIDRQILGEGGVCQPQV